MQPHNRRIKSQEQRNRETRIILLIIGAVILISIFSSKKENNSINPKQVPESEAAKTTAPEVDTTTPEQIVQKLSKKKNLTREEKKHLKAAKAELLEEERQIHERETVEHFKKECLNGCPECSFIPLRIYVEQSLEDPESFKLVKTLHAYDQKTGYMITSIVYRCNNAFGGTVTNRAYAIVDDNCKPMKIWLTD